MALFKCPECGNNVSDKASSCPKCGLPIENILLNTQESGDSFNTQPEFVYVPEVKKRRKLSAAWIVSIIFIVLVVCIVAAVIIMSQRVTTLSGRYDIKEDGCCLKVTFNKDGTIDGEVELSPEYDVLKYLSWFGDYSSEVVYNLQGNWEYSKNSNAFYIDIDCTYKINGVEISMPVSIFDKQIAFCDKDGVLSLNNKEYQRITG